MPQFTPFHARQIFWLLALCFTIALNLFGTLQTKAQEYAYISTTTPRLSFNFYDLSGRVFTERNLATDKPYTTVIFFDADCPHCASQAAEIAKNYRRFEDTQLVWVTIGSAESANGSNKLISPTDRKWFFCKIHNSRFGKRFQNWKAARLPS